MCPVTPPVRPWRGHKYWSKEGSWICASKLGQGEMFPSREDTLTACCSCLWKPHPAQLTHCLLALQEPAGGNQQDWANKGNRVRGFASSHCISRDVPRSHSVLPVTWRVLHRQINAVFVLKLCTDLTLGPSLRNELRTAASFQISRVSIWLSLC